MTYFNPEIYCKQNLKEKDREELEFYQERFESVIENAVDTYETMTESGIESVDKLVMDVVNNFVEELKVELGITLQELAVSVIDHYEEDVDPVEDYETFYYQPEEENEEGE